ncbi:MAG: CFI-box-CTERM domain-containing protein [Nitrososphaerota archaeon]
MQGLLFVLILLSGITVSQVFGLEYHDKDYNFTINYPENWNHSGNFRTDKVILSPVKFFDVTGQGWSAMLQVQFIDDQNFIGFETDKQAFDFLNSYIKRDCNKYTFENDAFVCTNLIINDTIVIEQNGKKYYETLYTWTELYAEDLGSNDDTSIVRMIPSDRRVWMLYTETYTQNYETHKNSFYSMMDSFVLPITELKTHETSTSLSDVITKETSEEGGGCLIATATFGSELAPQVQFLREIRDNTVLSTASGTSFMIAFNTFYYSLSPAVADLERQNLVFKETVKVAIIPLLSSLSLLQYADIDSEAEMLGYGLGIILLNIGMYFVAPAIFIYKIRQFL